MYGNSILTKMEGKLLKTEQLTLNQIRTYLDGRLGKKVTVTINHSKNKRSVAKGVVEETYPRIFLIKLDKKYPVTNQCYTYADILTKTVELDFHDEKHKVS